MLGRYNDKEQRNRCRYNETINFYCDYRVISPRFSSFVPSYSFLPYSDTVLLIFIDEWKRDRARGRRANGIILRNLINIRGMRKRTTLGG